MSTPLPPDFSTKTILPSSLESIQTQNINSAIFGALIMWGIWILYGSYNLWRRDKKRVVFILNFGQAFFYLIKIITVSLYVIFYKLSRPARSYLINIPQIICYILIYVILLKRLLRFEPFKIKNLIIPKLAVIIFYSVTLVVYVCVILAGVITSSSSLNSSGKCRTVYGLIYRQQYSLEIILEVFVASLLIIALTQRSDEIRNTSVNIFTQLRENENLRFFSIFIIITLKIILSYNNLNLGFDVLGLTHFIDSLRSILIYWALKSEYNKIVKAEFKEFKKNKNNNSNSNNNNTEYIGNLSRATNNDNLANLGRVTNNGSRRAYQQ